MKPYGTVLELACGTGWWTQLLAPDAESVTAVDAAPEMLELARQRVENANVRYVRSNVFEFEPEPRYDLVFFGFWLSHVPHDRFTAFWQIVRNAVSPTGHVFFIDELEDDATPERRVSRDEVVRTVQGREFRAVKVFYRPQELEARLRALGWQATVETAGRHFYWGRCRFENHA